MPARHKSPLPNDLLEFARELRLRQTDAEGLIWSLLRGRRFLGVKFRRQHPVAPDVLDSYCDELRMAIELDGGQHNSAESRRDDATRSAFLARQPIKCCDSGTTRCSVTWTQCWKHCFMPFNGSELQRTAVEICPLSHRERASSLLKNSTGCDIAGMRWQNIDVSRYFASRAKLCFALGEIEKSHEGFFQQAARVRGIQIYRVERISDRIARLPHPDRLPKGEGAAAFTTNGARAASHSGRESCGIAVVARHQFEAGLVAHVGKLVDACAMQ
ncbi:MAG TPA: endonuclease domain-containing protein [Pirellulales bacterium]|nr:endonuclease domain-containing protein [Pirellulales bacterium]